MKKQRYAIDKTDWCVTWKHGRTVTHYYARSLKAAKLWAKNKIGVIQYFKLSYEFKDVKEQ